MPGIRSIIKNQSGQGNGRRRIPGSRFKNNLKIIDINPADLLCGHESVVFIAYNYRIAKIVKA